MITRTPKSAAEQIGEYQLAPLDDPAAIVTPPLMTARPTRMVAPPAPPAMVLTPWYFAVVLLCAALFFLSYDRGLLIGQITACALAPSCLIGLAKGGIRKLFSIAGLVGAAYAGAALPDLIQPFLGTSLGVSSNLIGMAVTGVACLLLIFLMRQIGKGLRRRLEQIGWLAKADHLLGAMVGATEAALLVLTLCWVSTMLRPHALHLRDSGGAPLDSFQHQLAGNLVRLADDASAGPLGEFVHATNPIENVPMLRDAIDGLNQTGRLNFTGLDPALLEQARKMFGQTTGAEQSDIEGLLKQMRDQSPADDGGR